MPAPLHPERSWPLKVDAARRLGPRPVLLAAWHRGPMARAGLRRALAPAPMPMGPWFVGVAAAAAPALSPVHGAAVLALAAAVAPADYHGPFPPDRPAAGMDLFGPGDVRPVWERNRWAELPLLAQAHRLAPGAGHLARAEAFLAAWCAGNPAFQGPNWACGQEAALRALHLCLALGLLGASPGPAMAALLRLHARRIGAAPGYALAQDNNHAVSEAAGLFGIGLALADAAMVRQGAAALKQAVARLVAPCGSFAQVSTGYHRLLLDVLSVAEWLRRHHDGPPPDPLVMQRAAVAADWLWRLVEPASGASPRLGHQDGSAFADLGLAGPADARPSLERAALLFRGGSAGFGPEAGCAWLGLAAQGRTFLGARRWGSESLQGWAEGRARGLLRTGPLRFRPGHADLLHFELWDGPLTLLRDGGTGAYNPAPGQDWWLDALAGTAGHNTIGFDGAEQMPRLSRFLFARWPLAGVAAEGGWLADWRGNRHQRRVAVLARHWEVADVVSGPFATLELRWRLAPLDWQRTPHGVACAEASLDILADAPLEIALEQGWESPGYGVVQPVPVLVARARAPVRRLLTCIDLPPELNSLP